MKKVLLGILLVAGLAYVADPYIGRLYRKYVSDGKMVYYVPPCGHIRGEVPDFVVKQTDQRGLRVKEAKFKWRVPWDADYVLYLDTHFYPRQLASLDRDQMTLFVLEPPANCSWNRSYDDMFQSVYTWDDDEVGKPNRHRICFDNVLEVTTKKVPFADRKLACLVVGNKNSTFEHELYSERRRVIEFFEEKHPDDFVLHGWGWEKEGYSTYQGTIESKKEVLPNFRFNFAFENCEGVRGYVTEKIFDAFVGGCVPIYRGATNVTDYIPEDCFIDARQFASYDEMYDFLTAMTEEEHEHYLQNIAAFVEASKGGMFSVERYSEMFGEALDRMMAAGY